MLYWRKIGDITAPKTHKTDGQTVQTDAKVTGSRHGVKTLVSLVWRVIKEEEVKTFTLHTVWRISTFRSTEEMHSRKADWNRKQKTRSEKLGIWDNWKRNLLG